MLQRYSNMLYYEGVKEIEYIYSAQDKELDIGKNSIERAYYNTLYHYLDDYGCSRWEEILGIRYTALELSELTLRDRRIAIIQQIEAQAPYTWNWLLRLLDSVYGQGAYGCKYDPSLKKLTITTPKTHLFIAKSFYNILRRVIPANIVLVSNAIDTVDSSYGIGAGMIISESITIGGTIG